MKKKTIRMFCACEIEDNYKPTLFAADCKVTAEMIKDAILNFDPAFIHEEDLDANIELLLTADTGFSVTMLETEFFFEDVDFYYED